jgi:hypothetical protein
VSVQASATTANYPNVRIVWNITLRRYFNQTDFDERQRVVLLGSDVYSELFPGGEYPSTRRCRSTA